MSNLKVSCKFNKNFQQHNKAVWVIIIKVTKYCAVLDQTYTDSMDKINKWTGISLVIYIEAM